ncbi:hypothetical protein KR215_004729, partial [Drosophila sulfurigaster]
MNPSCTNNIESIECQKWISEAIAFCNRVLLAKQHEFWDDWWLNGHPIVYYYLPHFKSIYDCQKLKKDIARQQSELPFNTEVPQMDEERLEPAWQAALILIVGCLALIVIVSMIWMLNSSLRRIAAPRLRGCECSGFRKKRCCASPKSFISFGKPFGPLSRFGPYR